MQFTIIQGFAIIFAVFALSRVILRFKERAVSFRELIFWSVLWLAMILIAFLPGISGFIANIFGIGRGVDVLVYVSIIVLFYVLFRLYVKLDSMEQEITKLVRIVSLEKVKKRKK